ncbi:hypothetical protein [Phyllobacterium sp. K27]
MSVPQLFIVLSLLLGFVSPSYAMDIRWPTEREVNSVAQAINNNFADPYSIRDAEISQILVVNSEGGFICILANAKNRMGGYDGKRYSIAGLYADGRSTVIQPATKDEAASCGMLSFRAFAELYQ